MTTEPVQETRLQMLHGLSLLPVDYHAKPPTTPAEFAVASKHVFTAMAHHGLMVFDACAILDYFYHHAFNHGASSSPSGSPSTHDNQLASRDDAQTGVEMKSGFVASQDSTHDPALSNIVFVE
ncbi:hypothetical protein KCU92_g2956, partial [Aureobasidium melanogenum]|jgi:hypothetical protein